MGKSTFIWAGGLLLFFGLLAGVLGLQSSRAEQASDAAAVANQFLQAVSQGNSAGAFELCSSGLKRGKTAEDFLNKLNFGSKDEQKKALTNLVSKVVNQSPTQAQPDIGQIVNLATQNAVAQMQSQQTMASLGSQYGGGSGSPNTSAMSSPSYQTQGGTYTYGSGLGDTSGMGTGSNYVGP